MDLKGKKLVTAAQLVSDRTMIWLDLVTSSYISKYVTAWQYINNVPGWLSKGFITTQFPPKVISPNQREVTQ